MFCAAGISSRFNLRYRPELLILEYGSDKMDMYLEKILMQVEERYPSDAFDWIEDLIMESENG